MTIAVGSRVRIKTDPERSGHVIRTRELGGEERCQVAFADGTRWIESEYLEILPEGGEHPIELLEQGRLSSARALRRTLTHARLTGQLANVIYSLDTTGADFYAYQFRPLVKLLNSATTGILIADEVGLGKTIEAGLLWTEFRSRFNFQRLLVLCPSMLRQKWQRELRQRFGVESEIVGAGDLNQKLRQAVAEPDTSRFALIASLQGARPPRGWNDGNENKVGAAADLARFLDQQQNEQPLVDLVVIDEAHYLRNPEAMTTVLGQLVRGVSEYLVLLSATPVHLKSRDLFQLMKLADPATFSRPADFDDLLRANEPLVRARDLVMTGHAKADALRNELEVAASNPLLKGSQQLARLLSDLPSDDELQTPRVAAEFAGRIEMANLLGHVVTRTRKRDVREWRVIREPIAEVVPLTPVEKDFYTAVTQVVREYCAVRDVNEGFLTVMPQRQMTSCMPAAYRRWTVDDQSSDELMFEAFDVGTADSTDKGEELGPLVAELLARVGPLASYEQLRAQDSKYALLRDRLGRLHRERPREKVVLFSYFRDTLTYLRERLQEDGVHCLLLYGATEDKDAVVEEFRTSTLGTVLLSSEVASEGIDLQFSSVLVNYDLPWNPMRVEQRIGRLDRIGQESPRIAIWNLFYEQSIDERIYRRLYDRLKIFVQALGGIEPILGKAVRDLTWDLFRSQLTPAEEEARIEQTRLALENSRAEEERLESEAAHLVAYGDYIVNQIHAARDLSRKIDGSDLKSYVVEFLTEHYPGSVCRQTSPELDFEITPSQKAGGDFEDFLRQRKLLGTTKLARAGAQQIPCRFENTVASTKGSRFEVIGQLHPLVRFVSHQISQREASDLRPACAVRIPRAAAPSPVVARHVGFLVQLWSMHGTREWEFLHFAATDLEGGQAMLDPNDAERVVNAAADVGEEWLSAASDIDLEAASTLVSQSCLRSAKKAYEQREAELRAQNDDRALIQERTLERHYVQELSKLEEQLASHRARRTKLVAATEGKIRALTDRVQRKRGEIAKRRRFTAESSEICVGVIQIDD